MTLLVHNITLSRDAERNYAFALRDLSAHHYDGQVWVGNGNDQGTRLVEFWENRARIEHHESRSHFIWLTRDQEKREWHKKVTDTIPLLKQGLSRGGPSGSYSLDIPTTLTANSLIGYTSELPVTPAVVNLSSSRAARELQKETYEASVYYQEGHYTLDHSDKKNIGWKDKSAGWTILCFANVPVGYLEGKYVPGQPVLVNLGDLSYGPVTFTPGYVHAHVVKLIPPNSYTVKLARATGPRNGIQQVDVPDVVYKAPGGHQPHHRIKAN